MDKNEKRTGTFLAILAAFIYGVGSITAKLCYSAGGSTVTVTLFRNLFAAVILYAMARVKGISLKVTKPQLIRLALAAFVCGCCTAMGLYNAYKYISVGLTLCIHYCYPAIVALLYAVIYKEKLGRKKFIALVLSLIGIWVISFAGSEINILGIALALCSGLTYSIYLLIIDKCGLRVLSGLTISFYNTLFASFYLLIVNIFFMGADFSGIRVSIVPWLVLTALFVSCLGNSIVPEAVKRVGASTVSIFGIIEPFSSVLLGGLLLHEALTVRTGIGAVFILISAFILAKEG